MTRLSMTCCAFNIRAAVDWIAEVTGIPLTDDTYAADTTPGPLRSAIILIVGMLYDNRHDWSNHPTVNNLIAPYRRYAT